MQTFEAYQQEVTRTIDPSSSDEQLMANYSLGISGEAGEVSDKVKKLLFYGRTFTREDFAKELGDVLWYVTALAYVQRIPLEDVAALNVAKLRARFPLGFDRKLAANHNGL